MANTFTPGPWTIFHTGSIHTIVPAMRDGMIADLIDNEANARLIAAAPRVLEALNELLTFDSAAYDKGSDRARALLAARKRGWAAIAAAERGA